MINLGTYTEFRKDEFNNYKLIEDERNGPIRKLAFLLFKEDVIDDNNELGKGIPVELKALLEGLNEKQKQSFEIDYTGYFGEAYPIPNGSFQIPEQVMCITYINESYNALV